MSGIVGLGPDAQIVANEQGARQSDLPYRFDLLPARALLGVAATLDHGAKKYPGDNWRHISAQDHLNHALAHIFALQAGDAQDEHARHAATRILMWLELLEVNDVDRNHAGTGSGVDGSAGGLRELVGGGSPDAGDADARASEEGISGGE